MSDIKLRECPFCGGEFELSNNAVIQNGKCLWSAECMDCGCLIDDENKENLIKKINTRKPMDRIVEQLEEIETHCLEMCDWQGQTAICDAIEIVKGGGVE